MVETGEGRTPPSIPETLSNNIPHVSCMSTGSVLETSFRQACDSAKFESDPLKLLSQLLDQLVALGQIAQQLRQALGSYDYHPEEIGGDNSIPCKGGS